jgi:hypothetical protein
MNSSDYRPNPELHRHAYIIIPKPRKISKLYYKVPIVREITIEGSLGTVHPGIMLICTEYIRNAKQLRSLDIDFRFLELRSEENQGIPLAATDINDKLGVAGVRNVTEEMRRKKRGSIESAIWWWEAQDGKFA